MSSATLAPTIVLPYSYVALRLPSGTHKVTKIAPDTLISLGKYGSFHTNLLLGRPYFLTFEILDKTEDEPHAQLRVVPASELHADVIAEENIPSESSDETSDGISADARFDVVGEDGQLLIRNNRLTVDDSARQALSFEEIEELKKVGTDSGRDIIAKIMQSHAALDEKTSFSLAKYTLRKNRKYMRRFTVLPLDVSTLAIWMVLEKEPVKIMELREEVIGLITSWSNVHFSGPLTISPATNGSSHVGNGRWLVVDDAAGMVVAAMAERMGILYPGAVEADGDEDVQVDEDLQKGEEEKQETTAEPEHEAVGIQEDEERGTTAHNATPTPTIAAQPRNQRRHRRQPPDLMSAEDNTITLIHPASQPNVSVLSYFSYDPTETTQTGTIPSSSHPLHTHLKTVSWLQLLSPAQDNSYTEPEVVPDEVLASWKAGKRGTYYRKRRRWERIKRVVNETRDGGFDGLVVASVTSPISILHHLVPLLRGGAQVVVYSPNVEALAELIDAYSSARRTAILQALDDAADDEAEKGAGLLADIPNDDFPLDPRLLLSTNLQTVRAREWQVLPGRTHPLMTSRGGAEGFVFTGTRVLPVEGRVAARGTFAKKRKVADMDGVVV